MSAVNTEALAKAKSWELGTVRTTASGKKQIVFNPGVKIFVGDKEILIDPTYRNLYFNPIEEEITYKEGLVDEGKLEASTLAKIKEIVSERGITQTLRGKFVGV